MKKKDDIEFFYERKKSFYKIKEAFYAKKYPKFSSVELRLLIDIIEQEKKDIFRYNSIIASKPDPENNIRKAVSKLIKFSPSERLQFADQLELEKGEMGFQYREHDKAFEKRRKLQYRNISDLAKDEKVKDILGKYFEKPKLNRVPLIGDAGKSGKGNSIVIGLGVEHFIKLSLSVNNNLNKQQILDNADRIILDLSAKEKLVAKENISTRDTIHPESKVTILIRKSKFKELIKQIESDPKNIVLLKDNLGSRWFDIEYSLKYFKKQVYFKKSENTIFDCYEFGYVGEFGYEDKVGFVSNKKNVTICTLIEGTSFINFFIKAVNNYKIFLEKFLLKKEISKEECLCFLQTVQHFGSYSNWTKDYGNFTEKEIDIFYKLISSIPSNILNLDSQNILFQPKYEFQIGNGVIKGRPDFLIGEKIVEIKSTSGFFRVVDFYQVILYLFLAKFSNENNYPKKALIYYSYFGQIVEVDINSLIKSSEMKKLEKSLKLFFSEIKTKRV
jgi:hypothetical protein